MCKKQMGKRNTSFILTGDQGKRGEEFTSRSRHIKVRRALPLATGTFSSVFSSEETSSDVSYPLLKQTLQCYAAMLNLSPAASLLTWLPSVRSPLTERKRDGDSPSGDGVARWLLHVWSQIAMAVPNKARSLQQLLAGESLRHPPTVG